MIVDLNLKPWVIGLQANLVLISRAAVHRFLNDWSFSNSEDQDQNPWDLELAIPFSLAHITSRSMGETVDLSFFKNPGLFFSFCSLFQQNT